MTAPSETMMLLECGWCGTHLGEKPGHGERGPSTGICRPCALRLKHEDEATEDAEIALALDAKESGLRVYLQCLLCAHRVEGGLLLACPECGGALVPRFHKPMPGGAR